MPSKHGPISAFHAVAVAALLLSACGSGGDDAGTTPPPFQSPPPQPVVTLAEAYTELVASTSTSPQGWPAWTAPAGRPAVAGVSCVSSEVYHLHALVSLYKNGVRQGPPENVGRSGCTYELHFRTARQWQSSLEDLSRSVVTSKRADVQQHGYQGIAQQIIQGLS